MRIVRAVLAVAVSFVVLVAPVSAAPASNGDFVFGGGYRIGGLEPGDEPRVQFLVLAAAPGGSASGSYFYRHLVVDLTFLGRITCFDVAGNQAAVGGVITRLYRDEFGFNVGDAFLVFFIDNGHPSRGQAGPDVVSQTYLGNLGDVLTEEELGVFPNTCPDAAHDHDEFNVLGNFVVKDG